MTGSSATCLLRRSQSTDSNMGMTIIFPLTIVHVTNFGQTHLTGEIPPSKKFTSTIASRSMVFSQCDAGVRMMSSFNGEAVCVKMGYGRGRHGQLNEEMDGNDV